MNEYIITQLSIFVNNVPGKLAAVAKTLKDCNVNMKACNLAESTEFGILRAIVEDPDQSCEKLQAKGLIVRKTQLIGIKITDVPGSLYGPAKALGDGGINIEYGYAFTGKKVEGLFIRVDDPEKAITVLQQAGIALIRAAEI
ncbi:MAG: amino acid-binding protein [Methanomethylophilus sp.]